jgi:hypothetical protein
MLSHSACEISPPPNPTHLPSNDKREEEIEDDVKEEEAEEDDRTMENPAAIPAFFETVHRRGCTSSFSSR